MKRLNAIIRELEDIRDREAIRLWRLARKAAEHGCSTELCVKIRNEGWIVKRMLPDELLHLHFKMYIFDFAFKLGGNH